MSASDRRITIEGVRPAGAPIAHASFFHLTELNGDIILDVGTVDDQELVSQLQNPIALEVPMRTLAATLDATQRARRLRSRTLALLDRVDQARNDRSFA